MIWRLIRRSSLRAWGLRRAWTARGLSPEGVWTT